MDPTINAPSGAVKLPSSPEMEAKRPQTPASPDHPPSPSLSEAPISPPLKKYTEPLYTEINIPLPPVPKPKAKPLPPSTSPSRPRAHSLASFRPFHRRGSSADSGVGKEEAWPRIKKEVKSKEVAAAMSPARRDRRSGTIDALAVVPAVLVLSAELFTPGEDGKKREGKWEDGMI